MRACAGFSYCSTDPIKDTCTRSCRVRATTGNLNSGTSYEIGNRPNLKDIYHEVRVIYIMGPGCVTILWRLTRFGIVWQVSACLDCDVQGPRVPQHPRVRGFNGVDKSRQPGQREEPHHRGERNILLPLPAGTLRRCSLSPRRAFSGWLTSHDLTNPKIFS